MECKFCCNLCSDAEVFFWDEVRAATFVQTENGFKVRCQICFYHFLEFILLGGVVDNPWSAGLLIQLKLSLILLHKVV